MVRIFEVPQRFWSVLECISFRNGLMGDKSFERRMCLFSGLSVQADR